MPNRKIRPVDVNLGQIKRIVKSMAASETEDTVYCGTTSGDLLAIGYQGQFKAIGPEKNKYSLGVTALTCLKNGDLLAGCGDGKVLLLAPQNFKPKKFAMFFSTF